MSSVSMAVFEHADTRAAEPANDRARGAGAEVRRGYADLTRERLAETRAAHAIERRVANDGDRLADVANGAVAQDSGDDDLSRIVSLAERKARRT